ncbi:MULTISPECIES: 50S ribosomal protein L23 [unclassified Capnocytophaga]|uniref:50S ribosomal protein L23 n=1 Tax=unclassified Capnocytophaga TaxID=2640652 RepID=UPI000202B9A8|nr:MULTISPECIES: 50S ribosomal protein L23 [unclassified Capnocytophaga]EGD35240.1 50S ribosomal protein L23 [Capnocytophaga sp. oral taxon 338 str. F0234]MEB3003857.1 50S ribosomal protein L23 [Capnocytophaga sp. G2]
MSILIKPINTEKANNDSELRNCYTFSVDKKANKIQIKKAVEETYGVTVEKVRTLNYAPKRSVRYTKNGLQLAQTNAVKKAIVSVKEGKTIDFYNTI